MTNQPKTSGSPAVRSLGTLIGTWFGCGLVPKGPGTVGAMAAVAIAWLLERWFAWPPWAFAALAAAMTPVGVWGASSVARATGIDDPQRVVVDEVLGQWVTLAGAAHLTPAAFLLGLLLFRVFDITKPFPVRNLESLHGGWGIVADDLMAGVYGAVVLALAGWFNLY